MFGAGLPKVGLVISNWPPWSASNDAMVLMCSAGPNGRALPSPICTWPLLETCSVGVLPWPSRMVPLACTCSVGVNAVPALLGTARVTAGPRTVAPPMSPNSELSIVTLDSTEPAVHPAPAQLVPLNFTLAVDAT